MMCSCAGVDRIATTRLARFGIDQSSTHERNLLDTRSSATGVALLAKLMLLAGMCFYSSSSTHEQK
jgi:hypothetical protein